jgi:hypothetical protein
LEIANHALEEILLGIIQMTPIVMCIAALTSLTGLAADVVTTPTILLMILIRRHDKCNQNGGEPKETGYQSAPSGGLKEDVKCVIISSKNLFQLHIDPYI